MSAWLDPVREALDASPRPVRFFFRDDDAGWESTALSRLLDRCQARSVHIDVAVIPNDLDDDLVSELCKRAGTGFVHLHQHGFRHVNHEESGRKCEFGPSRSREQQLVDIDQGRLLLAERLGHHVDPVFTPPWNRCTDDTASVLAGLGFQVLSRDRTAVPLDVDGLAEIPITVDWFATSKGKPLSRHQIGHQIAGQIAAQSIAVVGTPIGIMLHHAVTDIDQLMLIGQLLTLVDLHPMATSTSIAYLSASTN
jgi:hypothetical protein